MGRERYKLPLFRPPGITCERCHGPGAAHISTNAAMLNPLKLPARRREAICMQCHLEGSIAIQRPREHCLLRFRARRRLFVRITSATSACRDGSARCGCFGPVGALAQSVCRTKSQGCQCLHELHDPHFSPSSEEGFLYQSRCQAYHDSALGAKRIGTNPESAANAACLPSAAHSLPIPRQPTTDPSCFTMPVLSSSPPSKPFYWSASSDFSENKAFT